MKAEITVTSLFHGIDGKKSELSPEQPYFEGCKVTRLGEESASGKAAYIQTYEADERDILMLAGRLGIELVLSEPSDEGKACGCEVCIEIYNWYRE